MLDKIKSNNEKVEILLTKQPDLRDNDNRLVAVFWAYEIGVDKLNEMSAPELLSKLSKGKLSAPETITRARRKVQEENEHLKGKFEKAKKMMAEHVRKNINK